MSAAATDALEVELAEARRAIAAQKRELARRDAKLALLEQGKHLVHSQTTATVHTDEGRVPVRDEPQQPEDREEEDWHVYSRKQSRGGERRDTHTRAHEGSNIANNNTENEATDSREGKLGVSEASPSEPTSGRDGETERRGSKQGRASRRHRDRDRDRGRDRDRRDRDRDRDRGRTTGQNMGTFDRHTQRHAEDGGVLGGVPGAGTQLHAETGGMLGGAPGAVSVSSISRLHITNNSILESGERVEDRIMAIEVCQARMEAKLDMVIPGLVTKVGVRARMKAVHGARTRVQYSGTLALKPALSLSLGPKLAVGAQQA